MNKLKTFNDGSYMPLWQRDIEFVQDAFREPFVKLCETLLGKNTGIICGCKVTSSLGTSISEGLVLMDGEVVYCPAQTVLGNGYVLQKVEAYDSSGDKVFKINDGTDVRQTYYKPYAKLVTGISIGATILVLNEQGKKTLLECLYDILMNFGYEIKVIDSGAGGLIGVGGTLKAEYAKIGRQVHILSLSKTAGGAIGAPPPGGGEIGGEEQGTAALPVSQIYTLPMVIKPVRDVYFSYQETDYDVMKFGKIDTDGKIYVAVPARAMTAVAFSYLT